MATTQDRIAAPAAAPPAAGANTMKWFGLAIAIALGLVILLMPTPTGLTVTGQRVLAIIAFTVALWVFQVLNKRGGSFAADDVEILAQLARSAALIVV